MSNLIAMPNFSYYFGEISLSKIITLVVVFIVGIVLFKARDKFIDLVTKPIQKDFVERELEATKRMFSILLGCIIVFVTCYLAIFTINKGILYSIFGTLMFTLSKSFGNIVVLLIIGTLLYGFRSKIVAKCLSFLNKASESKKETLQQVFTRLLGIFIIAIIIMQILIILGMDTATIVTVTGALSVAFGLAAKDFVNDFISGAIFIIEDQFHLGDVIEINGITGQVVEINLRTLVLRAVDGHLHVIPNGTVSVLTNLTRTFSRAAVTVGVAYEENIDRVIEVLKDEMILFEKDNEKEVIGLPTVLGVDELGASSVDIKVVCDCVPGQQWTLQREMLRRIKNRFDAEGICIPYPQRVVTINRED
ncbi:MAG: mechanosensitive ion channel family protein [Lachnospirales bacterium]